MFAHGLMFHHFHDNLHPKGQGAISGAEFSAILDHYGDRIVPAADWIRLASTDSLSPDQVCLTFDDALKCQIDIALPILRKRGLTAFWFVYSSVFKGNLETLEVFRYFRTVAFKDFDDFCDAFVAMATVIFGGRVAAGLAGVDIASYLSECPFYSFNDRLFRYLRDRVFTVQEYTTIVQRIMDAKSFNPETVRDILWMNDADLRTLSRGGHAIGLHSYTHPIRIAELPEHEQRQEYQQNFDHLREVVSMNPATASHPCNSYDDRTLKILSRLGVTMAFRATMAHGPAKTALEFPREDHANIIAALQ